MTASRRSQRAPSSIINRRTWLAGALTGAACGGFAAAAGAEPSTSLGDASKPSEPASSPALLASLLQKNHELRPDYGGGLANHLSMALYSLSALGADAAQLERFAGSQWAQLEPLPATPGPTIAPGSWKERLGQRAAIKGYRALFTQAIARDGRDATLRKYLPALLPAVGCDAFHPLIRTGYGVRFRDDHEVADGLAYWAIAFAPLGPLGSAGSERDPRVLLDSVNATPSLAGKSPRGRLIIDTMKLANELPGLEPELNALAPDDTTLAALAAATIRLYASTGDFILLHAVTGTHAYRLLSPFIAAPELGLRYLWQSVLAAYVSVGAPRVVDPPAGEVPAWSASLGRARVSLDEHVIKLVDVAHEQSAFYGDAVYRRAAARRVKLLPSG